MSNEQKAESVDLEALLGNTKPASPFKAHVYLGKDGSIKYGVVVSNGPWQAISLMQACHICADINKFKACMAEAAKEAQDPATPKRLRDAAAAKARGEKPAKATPVRDDAQMAALMNELQGK